MATNMAPHNLVEISEAIAAVIENPDIDVDGLLRHVKGPDFPTGGTIFGRRGIRDAYTNGKGKVVVRGKFQIETVKGGREHLVFTEIPYAVNKTVLITRIAELIREKILDGVSDLRDESDREGMRIVLELKKGAIPKLVLNRLFTHTPLQTTFGINNMVIVAGRPQCLGLKDLITYFIKHRVEVVTRRSRFELKKAEEKAHVLRGLVIALQNIDDVVQIIRSSKDTDLAKMRLMERFSLDEIQAQAILDMRLARLTYLETEKLQAELAEIEARIAYLKDLLLSDVKILEVVKTETIDIAKRYGDKRRTEVVPDEIEHINIEDLIKREEMVILISNKGFVKRVPTSAYRSQGRGGKGSNSATLMEEDFVEQLFVANTHDYLLFISSEGKAYWLKAHEIPEASRQARGAHIKGLLAISPNEEITTVIDFKDFSETEYVLMGTLRGVVKKVATSEFVNAKTRGIIGINLDEGDRLVSACLTTGNDEAILITRKGQALRISEKTVRVMGRASRGVCGIRLDKEDELAAMLRVSTTERILLLSEYGYGKRTDFDNFNAHGRGTGGQIIYCPEDKTGELVGAISVLDTDDVMVITSQGKTLKITAESVNVQGKAARGVRVVNIDRPDFVIGLDRVAQEEVAETQVEDPVEAQAEGGAVETLIEPKDSVAEAEAAEGDSEPGAAADEGDED
jgi:DNA gyrase subunit A